MSLQSRIYKVIDSDAADPTYVMQYSCPSLQEYHRSRDSFAPILQENLVGWLDTSRNNLGVFQSRLRYFLKMTKQNMRYGMVR